MTDSEGPMKLEEAYKKHAGDWLALEVLSRDANGQPEEVRLLASAPTRLEVCDMVRDRPAVYITFAGPIVPRGQGILYGCRDLPDLS